MLVAMSAPATTALLTDHYELTMIRATLASGMAERRSVFELFGRRLPDGRRYGVVAGVGRALEAIENFRFTGEQLEWLLTQNVVDEATANWLANYRFRGNVWGYGEGEVYFPGSPILVVESTFAEACVLETVLLSIYNHDSAIASAASRMTAVAGNRPCAEMGSRRTQEASAVAAARAAYVAGFDATSNLQAGYQYGVPTMGTAAHSYTLIHDDETGAFSAQLETLGEQTTLLVDTYDIENAIRAGVELTDGRLGAVRLDSGDLIFVAREVRDLLDDLGATKTRIVVTSDLDEWQIAALSGAPVDAYGVGTSVVTGSGAPTCSFVYKLVAKAATPDPNSELVPVEKKSKNKRSIGGRKFAVRRLDERGIAEAELVGIGAPPDSDANDRPLLRELVRDGEVIGAEPLEAARQRHKSSRGELPIAALRISKGDPALPTVMLDEDNGSTSHPYQRVVD